MSFHFFKTYPPEVAEFRLFLHSLIDREIERAVNEQHNNPNINPQLENRTTRERIVEKTAPLYDELARLEQFAIMSVIIEPPVAGPGRVFLKNPDGTFLDLGTTNPEL